MSATGFYTKGGKKRPITPRQGDFPRGHPKKTLSPLREKHYTSVRPDPPRDPPTSDNPEGGYQGWSNWDTWETKLLIDNDQQLYNQKISAEKNFLRKEKAGTFDREAARYYVQEYMVKAARKQDEGIDPKKVNLGEIVDSMLREAHENERYEKQKNRITKSDVEDLIRHRPDISREEAERMIGQRIPEQGEE